MSMYILYSHTHMFIQIFPSLTLSVSLFSCRLWYINPTCNSWVMTTKSNSVPGQLGNQNKIKTIIIYPTGKELLINQTSFVFLSTLVITVIAHQIIIKVKIWIFHFGSYIFVNKLLAYQTTIMRLCMYVSLQIFYILHKIENIKY